MTAPTKINYKIYQGSTFKEVLRWESYTKAYSLITGISKTAPVVITAPEHKLPIGWRFKVSGVSGMKEINSDEYKIADSITADSVAVNLVNATQFGDYISGGLIEYSAPKILTGLTARMQIRQKLSSTDVVLELTTENGGIVLDNILSTITLNITAAQTAELVNKSYVYSMEVIDGATVTQLTKGNLSLDFEVTR